MEYSCIRQISGHTSYSEVHFQLQVHIKNITIVSYRGCIPTYEVLKPWLYGYTHLSNLNCAPWGAKA